MSVCSRWSLRISRYRLEWQSMYLFLASFVGMCHRDSLEITVTFNIAPRHVSSVAMTFTEDPVLLVPHLHLSNGLWDQAILSAMTTNATTCCCSFLKNVPTFKYTDLGLVVQHHHRNELSVNIFSSDISKVCLQTVLNTIALSAFISTSRPHFYFDCWLCVDNVKLSPEAAVI